MIINAPTALQVRSLEREIAQIRQQRLLLQQEIHKLQEYAEIQAQVEKVESLLTRALGTGPAWEELLTNLSLGMPAELWLTDFSAAYNGKEGELLLCGFALTHHSLALWLEKLQEMDELDDVQCLFALVAEPEERTALQFEIRAVLLPGPPAADRKGIS